MQNSKSIAVLALLATVIMATVPSSGMVYADADTDIQSREERKAEKLIELADRAGQRVDNLIRLIFANATANETITNFGLMDDLIANVTLFKVGLGNLTKAYDALEAEDYQGAIANATDALRTFGEVFKALHIILDQSGVQKGRLIDAQGLIQAMKRALERIEKLREILPEDAEEALDLLDTAEQYLNITAARAWLLEGRVNETAHNLTRANRLIAKAHKYVKRQASAMNALRIENFLRGAEHVQERIMERLELASRKGLNVTAILESLGYANMTEFRQALHNMTETALERIQDIKEALEDLREIGETLRGIDRALSEQFQQQHRGNGNGQENNGSGHGNGNGNGKGHDKP